jgi:hypothetical protein
MLSFGNKRPRNLHTAPACSGGNVLASAKFLEHAYFFHIAVLLMPSHPLTLFNDAYAARLLRSDGSATGNSKP